MNYYAEHTLTNKHGVPPTLLHVEEMQGKTGFTTCYMFNEAVADWIMKNWNERRQTHGSFAGLAAAQLPVATDTLIADFDGDRESAIKFTSYLNQLGVGFAVYDSGGDEKASGVDSSRLHIVVGCEWKEDWRVPNSQLAFMESWAESCGASFDRSIYRPASLIRLTGTVHDRTGNLKQEVYRTEGHLLDYDLVEPSRGVAAAPQDQREILGTLWRLALSQPTPGGRRLRLWQILSQAQELGWGDKEMREVVEYWNGRLEKPLSPEELDNKYWSCI